MNYSSKSIYSIQCNGYSDGGVIGSAPAPIYGTVAAGQQVNLNWTAWPDSHVVCPYVSSPANKYEIGLLIGTDDHLYVSCSFRHH